MNDDRTQLSRKTLVKYERSQGSVIMYSNSDFQNETFFPSITISLTFSLHTGMEAARTENRPSRRFHEIDEAKVR